MAAATKGAHVLVVDDEPLTASGLTQYLTLQGYQTRAAYSVREAVTAIDSHMPDIVLLDLVMPEESGLDLLSELRQDPATQSLPVIVTSALKDTEDVVGALRAGANDYVTKPVDLPILLARLERHLAISNALAGLERQNDLSWQIAGAEDETTGACNRRHLLESLESEIHRSGRHSAPLSILVINLDAFTGVTGDHGPAGADSLLRQFVESMAGALRRSDRICRVDAHAFCALLPQTDEEGAIQASQQIRKWMENIAFTIDSEDVKTTVSIGVASLQPEHEGGAEGLLQMAIDAMMDAHSEGGNRVHLYDSQRQAARPVTSSL